MSKEKFEMLIEGGKAAPNQNLAQKLGPAGINLSQVLQQVNDKTSAFKGMKIPVKIIADLKSKTFEIEIGSPPVHELIKNEAAIQKGSGTPDKQKLANLSVEQVIKIAKMKQDSMLVKTLKSAVKSVAGSCNSAGILIEGKQSKEFTKEVNQGKYDKEIQEESTEFSQDKKTQLKSQLDSYNEKIKKELEKIAAAQAIAAAAAPVAAAATPAAAAATPAAGAKPGAAGKTPVTAPGAKAPAAAKAEAKPAAKGKK
ncbi:MAG TPA: 50S ribosomal protein L11 [Candidatus Nanoarchaeia archaeon]|nr:50S ribosomal protein L11 [Candidatus Nanoarchaeia archaeon]